LRVRRSSGQRLAFPETRRATIRSHNQATAAGDPGDSVPAEYEAWRQGRWEEIAGPNGKAKVVANGKVVGRDVHTLPGVLGQWSTNEAGAPTGTAAVEDGVKVGGEAVEGTGRNTFRQPS
jgi:hypothetical protein